MQKNTGRGYETGLMVLLSLAFGFVFFDRNAMNYLAPFVAPDLKLSKTQIGLLSSGFSLAWASAGFYLSTLSDRFHRRKSFLLVTFVVFSICSVLSGFAASFAMLLAARIVMGMSEGPILPISQSLVILESSEERRGLNMGFTQNFGSNLIGSTLAPLVLVWLADRFGWRTAFYIAGVPGLILAILIWKYVREPRAPAPDATARSGAAPLRILDMIRARNIWLCVLISIFMVPWMILGWVFLPFYYTEFRHVTHFEMSVLMSVLGISAAFFSFIVPGLSDRIGRKPVVVAFSLIGVLVPLAALFYTGSLWVLGALIFVGWSASGVFPLFMATIPSETLPPRYLASSIGIVMGLGEAIGGVLMPYWAGVAADSYGLRAPLMIEAALGLVGAGLALFLVETAPACVKARALAPGTP